VTYRGKVTSGVIVLEPGVHLPEGADVEVELIEFEGIDEEKDPLLGILDLAGPTGIPDLSVNIDHYLYGHPKVDVDPDQKGA